MNDGWIGIIGTLLGTILGWCLNLISNTIGRIDISVVHCSCEFFDLNRNQQVFFYEKLNYASIDLTFRVTNFKNHMVGLNNYCILLECGEKNIPLLDFSLQEDREDDDNLEELVNIPAHYTKSIYYKHRVFIAPESESLRNGFKIVMMYHINGKRKKYKKVLHEEKPHNEN